MTARGVRLWTIVIGISALATVEALLWVASIPKYILPRPTVVLEELMRSGVVLLEHAMITFGEAGTGLVLALVISLSVAVPASMVPAIRGAASSFLVVVQSMPVIALGPLLSAWLGPGPASKAVLAAVVCYPPIAATVLRGLVDCPPEEIELYHSMGATRLGVLWLVRVPRAVPSFFLALTIGLPLAVLGAIVGEFVGASKGLGFWIMTSSYYLRTDSMFAAILLASAGSIAGVSGIRALRRKLSWERHSSGAS